MSTGLAMFLAPAARVPPAWAGAAFLLGATVLSIPLARTSRLVRRGDVVVLERSGAFLWVVLGAGARGCRSAPAGCSARRPRSPPVPQPRGERLRRLGVHLVAEELRREPRV